MRKQPHHPLAGRAARLVVRAGAWLCANTDDLDEKQCCLEAMPDLGRTKTMRGSVAAATAAR